MAADAFPTLTTETLDTIRARMTARVNLGIIPGNPLFLDALIGSIWGDLVGTVAMELDEYFDFANEVARAILPTTTYGEWLDGWADSVGLERKDAAAATGVLRFTGPDGTDVIAGNSYSTEPAAADAEPITFQVTASGTIVGGILDLPAEADETGSIGNVPADTIRVPALETAGVTVTNPAPMSSGADVESDEALRVRVLLELKSVSGNGNQADYIRWGLEDPGVGFVTVEPNWSGPGTVRIFLSDPSNDPVGPIVRDRVKARIDPGNGDGTGLAPVGAHVTAAAPTSTDVDIVTDITLEPGYSLDGLGGTIDVSDAVEAAIRTYIDLLPVGADIIRDQLIRAIVGVVGVVKTVTLTINGSSSGDVAIAATSVAHADDVTIT
jgi:uncharacterized phage protein gp47/JayE